MADHHAFAYQVYFSPPQLRLIFESSVLTLLNTINTTIYKVFRM